MSLHVCPKCGHEEQHIRRRRRRAHGRRARRAAARALPLDTRVREEADSGAPTVVSAPGTPRAAAYVEMARHTAGALARRGRDRRGQFPEIASRRAEPSMSINSDTWIRRMAATTA